MNYKCSYCGAEYSQAIDRAKCELVCDEKAKQEAELSRVRKLREERAARYNEILKKTEELNRMWVEYEKDYGNRMPESVEDSFSFLLCRAVNGAG